MLSLIGISDDDGLGEYDPCSLFALRAVNAVGAPACLYYAYNRCQRLLSQVGFHFEVSVCYGKNMNIIDSCSGFCYFFTLYNFTLYSVETR